MRWIVFMLLWLDDILHEAGFLLENNYFVEGAKI